MSDILTVGHASSHSVRSIIAETEGRYSDRKKENDGWREWLRRPGNEGRFQEAFPDVDILAAFASDCRSDTLTCGACALRLAIRKLNEMEGVTNA